MPAPSDSVSPDPAPELDPLLDPADERANYPRTVAVTKANRDTMKFIRKTDCRMIAEIGIYHGDTTSAIAEWLAGAGELHLFDFQDRIDDVVARLDGEGHTTKVRTFASTYKLLDSYNWPLAKLLGENPGPIYDYVLLDGAHTWAVDALTTLLVDRLLKVGGYLDFDDYHWTLAGSPSLRPEVFPLTGRMYTEEQMATAQVKMICDLLIRPDPRYQEVVKNRIFRKVAA